MATISTYFGLLLLMLLISLSVTRDAYSISQISPKSESVQLDSDDYFETSSNIIFDSSKIHYDENLDKQELNELNEINNNEYHQRIERSALPIINELSSRPSFTYHEKDENLEHFDSNDVESSGRYYHLINPTKTKGFELGSVGEITQSNRMGKDLEGGGDGNNDDDDAESFLLKGGPRSVSGPPKNLMTTVMPMVSIAVANNLNSTGRQNPNPDIQDIITGIVKLLNGNVNVHANTQSSRRPVTTRINNRGPPRISDAQILPIDYDMPPTSSSHRPPPYPFERPEGPVRPFLTGVPIPEQIVPSMQQNYRPGFVSQNRPPWQRPRPRPPITPNRRPFPYKPLPLMPEYHPEDEIQLTTQYTDNNPNNNNNNNNNEAIVENQTEANNIIDNINNYKVEEETHDNDDNNSDDNNKNEMILPTEITQSPKKKDELFIKKKDKNSNKKTVTQQTIPLEFPNKTDESLVVTESVSEVNTVEELITIKPSETSVLESSFDEVITTGISETPILNTMKTMVTKDYPSITTSVATTTTTTTTTILTKEFITSASNIIHSGSTSSVVGPIGQQSYHPRPGIVLDDPEFKPGGQVRPAPGLQQRPRPPIQPTKPPGYGEIFDVTLSAIQGPAGSGSKQTINIKPFGSYPRPGGNNNNNVGSGSGTGNGDIIVSPSSGDDGFVSIDGKRTYINLFGEQTDAPSTSQTQITVNPTQVIPPGVTGTGYAVAETEAPIKVPHPPNRNHYRPRPQQPPVRIDTCIVGDDSTCDQAQNEKCKTESGVSSCHCRPGFSRRKHREPCRKVVSLILSLRVDKMYERRIVWDNQLLDISSDAYGQLTYEAVRAIDSAMSMTPFSDEFIEAKVNRIYNGDATQGTAGVFVNLTLMLEENSETLRPSLKADIQRHLLGVIHRRNNNIGNSALFVESPPGSISNLQDLDECTSSELNDCHPEASCSNVWGSFRCDCPQGLRDPWFDQPQRAGRECHSCPESYCNNRGMCSYDAGGNQICNCIGSYYGSLCEIDGEVLGVAIGASVAAVVIIVLTLICLVMWSRRWHREQKNAIGSPVFGYMTGAPVKTPSMGQAPYQVSLEDRMRWAQIADVMAQANHYGAEPVGSTRPSSAIFGYPTLQAIGNMNNLANMSNLGTMSLAGTLPIHSGNLPPVPLPRLGLHSRSSGMRTLENSSSSEEEDRTDLLGRNFHVPRPKSRSNGSIANQSGIYYDVDYEPSGGEMYGTTHNLSNQIPGIPMSTYTSGKAPSVYYMK